MTEDRLKRIAEEAFSNLDESQAWLETATQDLWQGSVELVIKACQLLAKKSNLAKQALSYYGIQHRAHALCPIPCTRSSDW